MDGLRKAGSLSPGRPPMGSAGDGQGAFENFLASAIATIVTIIFSWRLLLETQESGPRVIEATERKSDKFEHNKLHEYAPEEEVGENTQVDIDQRSVSKVTSKSATATSEASERTDAEHDESVTANGYQTIRASKHVNTMQRDNHAGFVVLGKLAGSSNTCVTHPDQYLPASGAAAAKDSNQALDANRDEEINPEGLLPRPTWALESQTSVTSTASIELATGVSPSDSSGEEDTETEGDVSSDSTLEYNDECDDADQSDSDTSLSNSYSGTDTREFYLVGDPLGDDDSESEYCVVFNSMLEAITEEDTDDMSEIERDANETSKRNKLSIEIDEVDSFVVPSTDENIKRDDNESDSAINNDKLSDAEITSDTNSIEVGIDTDAASSTSTVYGPIINTQRPLVIGPYRDRGSKFSQEQTFKYSGTGNNEFSAPDMETDIDKSSINTVLPPKLPEGTYLERARAILWGLPGPTDIPPYSQVDQNVVKHNLNFTATDRKSPEVIERNLPLSNELQMEQIPFQSTADKRIEDDKYDLDRSQSSGGSDRGERKDFNINVFDDPISIQALHTGQDDRSSTNADSDLDSLTECFDQFKKVALNHLEHTTASQLGDNTKQSNENGSGKSEQNNGEFRNFRLESVGVKEKEKDRDSSLKCLSNTDFDNHKLLSDNSISAQVVYGGSVDNLYQSDKVSSKFDDAPLSAAGRGETPAQSFTFVRTMNIERNYVLRNTSTDKNINVNSNRFNDDKSLDEETVHDRTDNMPGTSPYVSNTIGGLSSFDNRNNTGSSFVWNDMHISNHTQRGITPKNEQNYFMDSKIHGQPRGGPIAETTVGKFNVRPHPHYKELELNSQFIPQNKTGHNDRDQVKTSNAMYNKRSKEVGYDRTKEISSGLTGLNGHSHSEEPRHYDQRGQMEWNYTPRKNMSNSTDARSPERFDQKYFQAMQPYGHNGQITGADSNQRQLASRSLYNVDELADRETFDLSGNIVAHRNMHETQGAPCRVVATSSALARRGDPSDIDPELPPVGSAVASTEATSDNPYIAVARATARAATIASANAAGTVASGSGDPDSSGDISVVVSTSCTIKDGSKDSTNSVAKIAYPEPEHSLHNRQSELNPAQQKKMMITIEESQDSNRREYRTLECEVPKDIGGDVTAMISEAVKRIIASQSSLTHHKGNQMNTAIDQITRQVVSAYREPDQQGEVPRYSVPPQKLALYDTPTVKAQTIPEFRAQNTPQLYHAQTPARPAISIMKPNRDSNARPGAYLSRVINKPGDPDKSTFFGEKDDKPIFYVTGKYPTADSETRSTDDVVLKVVTDKNMQPSVEHVLLSESESDIETPLMERKKHDKLKDIKEEVTALAEDPEMKKKKKPARPKLQQPSKPNREELGYVPPESWSVCTGCPTDSNTSKRKDKPNDVTSTETSDKVVKGILKTRPSSTTENKEDRIDQAGRIPKSKSTGDVSGSKYQPLAKTSGSGTGNKDSPKKPYQSVLLTPINKVEKKEKPSEAISPPPMSPNDQVSETKKFFFKDAKPANLDKNEIPVAIPNTRPTRIDIEFDKRTKEWRTRTPSPKSNVVMVDIDIDGSRKSRSRSVEDLKQKLNRTQLKAPSNDHIEKQWEGVSYKLSRSQERVGGYRSRGDSFSSDVSQSYSSGMRRSTSMGTLPGQFFSDKRSYTSLIETDLDTGISTEIPLIKETNVDEILTKSKSMTNLNTATSFKTYNIYNDDVRYKSSEMISNNSSHSSERDALNDIPVENKMTEKCRSAHELRISNSLNKLSLPPWFRATETPAAKPVQLVNTKMPPRIPFELPPSNEKSKPRPKLEILPSKPIIINHRVSRSVSKSPSSSTCSTPVSGPPSFELPSNKLRQNRETSLSPIPIKSPDEVPPLPPRNYKKETARDSYLKLKAKANPESWEPLSVLRSPDVSSKPFDVMHASHHYQSRPSQGSEEDEVNTHRPQRQEEIYVSQKYISISNSENSSIMSEPHAPKLPPRNYLGESSDSGVASLEHTQRYDSPDKTQESAVFTPGRTVTSLVRNLKIDTSQVSPLHDSGIESGSPDAAYKRMMTTLESERQNIENKAAEISSPYTGNAVTGKCSNEEEEISSNRNSFPVLSLTSSPGTKRRSFRSVDSVRTVKVPEPTNVTMTLSRQSFKTESKNEATILDMNRKESHSLDEVLGGLLAIPPPPGHPDDDYDDDDDDDFHDGSDAEETPKERNFKILKQASTPKGSQVSLKHDSQNDQSETEIDEEAVVIQCRNTKCGRSTKLSEARKSFKTCHNCFTYYCSRDCRKEHWERHKRKCLFSRINSGCKHIMKKVHNSDTIAEELSKIARTGYLTKGRGCVMLVFPSPLEADKFLMKGFAASQKNPANYANIKDIQDARDIFAEHEQELVQMCKSYNPELKYVLEVAIVADQETPTWPIPRREGPIIKKCAKVRLHSSAASRQAKKDEPDTLVLTAVPGAEFTENMEEKKAREICFVNIQRQLRQKGVSLRHQYPEIYKKLCAYVADNEHFTPISLYPLDSNTGKRFMCLIMPNSEPEVNWMYNPGLLDDLDVHTQV